MNRVSTESLNNQSFELTHPAGGAVLEFRGVVRDHDGGEGVHSIDYEAHESASEVLERIVAEAAAMDGVHLARACHRVGHLQVGDVALLASVSASHRGQAFEALSWMIEEIKRSLPVWKNQHFADGHSVWTGLP